MASRTIFPFDFNPVNVVSSGSSYTCPVGKYAKVVATLNVNAYATTAPLAPVTDLTISNGTDSTTVEFWVTEGDALTKSTTAASATATAQDGNLNSKSTAALNVNGNAVARIDAGCNLSWDHNASITGTIGGDADVLWVIMEYNKLT